MKKRFFSIILCIALLISSVPLSGVDDFMSMLSVFASANENSSDSQTIYYGDVDENGRITASDARTVLRCAAGISELTHRQMLICDINSDNYITAADARTILRTAADLEDPVPFETGEPITQGDYLVSLMDNLGLSGSIADEPYFENITNEHPLYDVVQSAVEWGILDPDSPFTPDAEATYDFVTETTMKAVDCTNIEDISVSKDTNMSDNCPVNDATEIIEAAKEIKLNAQPEEEFESIKISDTVKEFNASEITAVDSDTYTFNNYGDDIPETGDIFIAETSDGQFAEKIVSVTENDDGTYTAETIQPDMDEVFDDFSFVDYATPDSEEFSFTPAEGVFLTDGADSFEMLAKGRAKDDKDVFGINLELNSTDVPGMLPDMCCTMSSDYIEALNIASENKNIPNSKKILEDYNQQLSILTGEDGEKTVVATPVKKYESGWSLKVDISLSNFEVDFDFKDFWETGNYQIGFSADVTQNINFEGKLSAKKHLGTLHFTHGIKRLLFKVDIEVYAYIDINGKIIITGDGSICQTYGNYDGKTDTLSNNTFAPSFNANINAEAGFDFCPAISTLGFELAKVSIQIGVNGSAELDIVPLVEHNNTLYYYPDNPLEPPEELELNVLACLSLELSFPIVRVTVGAGEDIKKQVEKWQKKGKDIPNIPLEVTFKICTLDKDSLLKPKTLSLHTELTDKLKKVDECTAESYETLAHMCSGYVVKKGTDEVLANAKVQLVDKDDKVVSTATTDLNGEFDLKFIPYGEYSVKIISEGTEMTLDKKVTIDKNESNIGKLEFEVDLIKLYAEQVKKSMEIIQPHTPSTYKYIGATICNLISNNSTPELAIIYYERLPDPVGNDFFVIHLYEYKNNKVTFVDYYTVLYAGANDMMLWKDPLTNDYSLACASTFSEGWKFYQYNLLSSTKEEILFEDHCWHSYQYIDARYKNSINFITDYEKYIVFHFGTPDYKFNVYTAYEWYDYTHYLFNKYSYPSNVKIHIVNDNGTYEVKEFNF